MANANTPRGLIPYAMIWGGKYNGSFNTYFVPSSYATALYIGDPVKVVSASSDNYGNPGVNLAATGDTVLGVVIGIINGGDMGAITAVTRDLPVYHAASTAGYVAVCDDPNVLYEIQDDASSQATAPNLFVGKNANFAAGSGGSTVTGYSSYALNASTVATTNTLDLKIIRGLQQPDNLIGTAANTNMNAKWLVKLNKSLWANQTAGA